MKKIQDRTKLTKNSNNSQENYEHTCDIDPESGRLRGKYISDNVFNLSKKWFSEAEIKLLSRGLDFVPMPEKIDRW